MERSELAKLHCPRLLGMQLTALLFWKEKENRRSMIVTATWNLWNERNNIREEGRRRSALNWLPEARKLMLRRQNCSLKGETNTTVGGPANHP
jgi:hypothetical protein